MPRGWEVVRLAPEAFDPGPTHDDLLALADAVREAARPVAEPEPLGVSSRGRGVIEVGRRGHLRVLRDPTG